MTTTKLRRIAPRIVVVAAVATAMAVGIALPANAQVLLEDYAFFDNFQSYPEFANTGTLGPWNIEGGATIWAGGSNSPDGLSDGNIFLSGAQSPAQGPGSIGPVAINRDFTTVAGTQYQFAISASVGALQESPALPTDGTTGSQYQIFIDGVLVETFVKFDISTGIEYGVFTATGPSSNIRIVSTGVGLNGAAGILNGVRVYDTTACLAGPPLPVSIVSPPVALIGLGILALGAVIAVVVIRKTRDEQGGRGSAAIVTTLSVVAVLGIAGFVATSAAPAIAAPSISDNCAVSFAVNP